jgi:C4-type Zn-finger protein
MDSLDLSYVISKLLKRERVCEILPRLYRVQEGDTKLTVVIRDQEFEITIVSK